MNVRKQSSRPSSFNWLARTLHWLMAALVLAMLFIGVAMVTSFEHRLWLIDLHLAIKISMSIAKS